MQDGKKLMVIVDSEIVTAMINKERYGFSTFAGNYTGEIQQSNQSVKWYWAKGSFNIADIAPIEGTHLQT